MITEITSKNEINPSEMFPEELTEYKQHIANLINRLTSEGCIEPDITTVDEKLQIEIKLKEPTWYKELDENTKDMVFENARFHVMELLKGLKILDVDDKKMDTELENIINEVSDCEVSECESPKSMEDID
jgi:hypothetical protein